MDILFHTTYIQHKFSHPVTNGNSLRNTFINFCQVVTVYLCHIGTRTFRATQVITMAADAKAPVAAGTSAVIILQDERILVFDDEISLPSVPSNFENGNMVVLFLDIN